MAENADKRSNIMGNLTKQFKRKPKNYIIQIIQFTESEYPNAKYIAAFNSLVLIIYKCVFNSPR